MALSIGRAYDIPTVALRYFNIGRVLVTGAQGSSAVTRWSITPNVAPR